MTAKPKRDSSGKFLPKWAGELREALANTQRLTLAHENDLSTVNRVMFQHSGKIGELQAGQDSHEQNITNLSSRLGTSTPLIIWNIAVLIAIAGLGAAVAKLYGVGP